MRPTQPEALRYLAQLCRLNLRYAEGFLFAMTGKVIAVPDDGLFVQHDACAWQLWDELAVNAYWIGQYEVREDACRHLLATMRHPSSDTPRIRSNLAHAQARRLDYRPGTIYK